MMEHAIGSEKGQRACRPPPTAQSFTISRAPWRLRKQRAPLLHFLHRAARPRAAVWGCPCHPRALRHASRDHFGEPEGTGG
eukprot:scaffold3348_cov113-Isochrysis_galbana.AAC.13